jgi:hypothetical protein
MGKINNCEDDATKILKDGMSFLRAGKISEAEECFREALKWKQNVDKALFVLNEIQEGKKWSAKCFCGNCGKLIVPEDSYPRLTFSSFCPNCGRSVDTSKEEFIALFEFLTKIVAFGVFLPILIIFCCIPFRQATMSGIWYLWNPLLDGIFSAMSFTPIIIVTLLLIGDPWGFTLQHMHALIFNFAKNNFAARFLISASLLFIVLYIYFFLLLTPFFAAHRRGLWRSMAHQKKLLFYTFLIFVIIMLIRIGAGVFY